MKFDIYAEITNRLISDLQQGTIPWYRAWSVAKEGCYSYTSGKRYSLLNTLLLGGESGEYLTFKAAQAAGGSVRKGEKSSMVVFWSMIKKEKENGEEDLIPFLRYYNVFHVNQCEGIEPHADFTRETFETQPIEAAEAILHQYAAREGIRLEISETNDAYYQPATDTVHLPAIQQYENAAEYYSTAFHELAHSTGAKHRLNRLESGHEAYSREELVAELAAAYLLHMCGIETSSTFRNSEGYIQGWLKALKNDYRMVVSAAGRAEKAVARILGESEVTE